MIYIAAHKRFTDIGLKNYMPLQVGAYKKDSLGYLRDDSGDSISFKNSNYCELTGLYWIWKNTSDDYKGLVHYRRYFGKSNLSSSVNKIYLYDELINMLECVDIILPYVERFKQNSKDELLISCCTPEIFEELRSIVLSLYPDYIDCFDNFFSDNKASLFNMMFCRKDLFDSYCHWLFDILFELDNKIDLSGLNQYQQRLFGFLSERLLNIWVMKNNLKAINLPVIATELKPIERIRLIRRRYTNNICFKLNRENN